MIESKILDNRHRTIVLTEEIEAYSHDDVATENLSYVFSNISTAGQANTYNTF